MEKARDDISRQMEEKASGKSTSLMGAHLRVAQAR